MMKFYTLLFALFFGGTATAQITIWSEDFETDGNTMNGGSRYTAANEFLDGKDDYFGRIEGATKIYQPTTCATQVIDLIGTGLAGTQNGAYSGYHGNFYVAGEDMNDAPGGLSCGLANTGSAKRNIVINSINIGGGTVLSFKGLFGACNENACGGNAYDDADYVKISYNVDGTGVVEALCFNPDLECNIPGDTSNEPLYHDPDCDGDGGDGTLLGCAMQEFSFSFPSGFSVDIDIEISMDSGNEEFAVDWLRIESATNLSVDLVDFNAKKQQQDVMVFWKTQEEQNNDFFEIERSIDGLNFSSIARVQGAGNSTQVNHYNFLDNKLPVAAQLYYRLNQVDFNGNSTRSNIVVIENKIKHNNEIQIYPNPVRQEGFLNIASGFSGQVTVSIFSIDGKKVFSDIFENEEGIFQLNIASLEKGSYFIRVASEGEFAVKRFIKM